MKVSERIERAKANAAREARRAGKSEAEVHAAVKEAEEIHSDPRTQIAYNRMEDDQAARQEAERRGEVQRRNREEREFKEALDKHHEDSLNLYLATRPGRTAADFDRDVWPEIRRAFVAGEEDPMDRERREKSAPVF